jgi:hypothetical protein
MLSDCASKPHDPTLCKCVPIAFHGYVSRGLLTNARRPTPLSIPVDPDRIKRYRARAVSEFSIYTTRHSTRIQSHSVPMVETVCERLLSCPVAQRAWRPRVVIVIVLVCHFVMLVLHLLRGCWASLPMYRLIEI